MTEKITHGVYKFCSSPSVLGYAAVVGKKEGEGPLSAYFDKVYEDTAMGEASWEKAESKLQENAFNTALSKAGIKPEAIDVMFAGDLLNQCIGSAYAARKQELPFLGLYGACSTMAESTLIASAFADNGLADYAAAITSSHFCSAERQFRYPLEYGGVRPPTAQWTVTGSGALIIGKSSKPPYIKGACVGVIQDLDVTDINNMGAAMAPAAAYTIKKYLSETSTSPSDYSAIFTGDLGYVGSELLNSLLLREDIDLKTVHRDCGCLIFDREAQDVHAGGSGCGCSASVLCSYILKHVESGKMQDVLFIATGALMSPTSNQQGESIPGIAHLIHFSNTPWEETK